MPAGYWIRGRRQPGANEGIGVLSRAIAFQILASLTLLSAAPISLFTQLDRSVFSDHWNEIRLLTQCLAERGLEACEENDVGRTICTKRRFRPRTPTVVVLLLDAGAECERLVSPACGGR